MKIANILFLPLSLVCLSSAQDECEEVITQQDFDLESYVSERWYVHQQAVTQYSPVEWNFCSYAEYTIRDKSTFWGYSVEVKNYAEDADGNRFGGPLCAAQDSDEPSKLSVAPCVVPRRFAGPYWVVAYDEEDGYALVSGGQPTIKGENGCRTGDGVNNSGLWIFLRTPERNETLISEVRDIATAQGFDLSALNDVVHENCAYEEPCVDQEGKFRVFGFGPKIDCAYVARNPGFRCSLSRGNCPATCGGEC